MTIVGYGDRWSVEPGGTVRFMVSSEVERYRADIVRLVHGDGNPAGPGFKSDRVESSVSGEYEGRLQLIRPGSFVRVPDNARLDLRVSFAVEAWIYPTTPRKERQALISKRFVLELGLVGGRLELRVGDQTARLGYAIERPAWFHVSAAYDSDAREARLSLDPLEPTSYRLAVSANVPFSEQPLQEAVGGDLLIAAADGDDGPTDFYNGKLEALLLMAGSEVIGHWDFSADISSRRVRDASGNGLDGRAVNMPTRGVTGHNWDGSETAWRHAPEQYGAIHFHDDDLDDAGWDVDFEWTVPLDTPSGVYAARLAADGEEDHIPFFLRPKPGRPTAEILFLAPLFSYLAYANEQMLARIVGASPEARAEYIQRFALKFPDVELGAAVRDYPSTPQDRYIVDNRLLSLYDCHSDGSGVCYSSWLRPLVNMRPDSFQSGLSFGRGAPHQFSADLYLVDWLHEHGYAFDVVTDVDLHHERIELLEPYRVVLTGTHAEYWSSEMLDALNDYLIGGGRLMYLGGNAFYWVTQLDPEEGHTIEIRRAPPATSVWRTAPGEAHLSTTGEPGGIWRYRGRAPQRLVGIGFTAQGAGPGRPYARQPGSHDPRVAFVFDGIAADELIGDFPCLVNDYGAAGFEIDRMDERLGSPRDTVLLASATGFSDNYQHAVEEVLFADSRQGGAVNPLVRADMVYCEYPNGGAVFTPGSITWCGCLSFNNYDNNVSRITRNVLDRFVA